MNDSYKLWKYRKEKEGNVDKSKIKKNVVVDNDCMYLGKKIFITTNTDEQANDWNCQKIKKREKALGLKFQYFIFDRNFNLKFKLSWCLRG